MHIVHVYAQKRCLIRERERERERVMFVVFCHSSWIRSKNDDCSTFYFGNVLQFVV